ncbi:MAG: hypothetical protein IJS25_03020 [Bacteroidales bacterium]|nr:hypothetical protein [Bacteroidales bacterium]
MGKRFFLFLMMALPLCGMAAAQEADYRLVLQKADLLEGSAMDGTRWEGWGTSLCWWANRVGYNPALTQASARLFFDAEAGLGLNIMRYNIGGGDDPSHRHITRTDSDVPGWLYVEADGRQIYRYDADSCQLNVLRAAADAAGDDAYIEVFSNSPPYFMTNSGCSSGNVKADENNLRDDAYEAFAEYLAHVTNYMVNNMGLNVKSVSPMNEPNTNYWSALSNKQEGCHFDAGAPQSRILVETSKALERYGLGRLVLVASDETNPALQIEEIEKYTPEARKVIDRISSHTYSTNRIKELGDLVRKERINLWMSETDGANTSGEQAGEMRAGLWMAEKIITDIRDMRPSAWVMWQVIDTHVSANGYKGRRDSGPLRTARGYWGLSCANHDTNEIQLSQKYYAFGQFSRYIRPGDVLVLSDLQATGGASETAGQGRPRTACRTLSAWNAAKRRLTVVCTNASASEKTVDIDISDFGLRKANVKIVRTSGSMADGEHWADAGSARTKKGSARFTLAPNSVTTLIFNK